MGTEDVKVTAKDMYKYKERLRLYKRVQFPPWSEFFSVLVWAPFPSVEDNPGAPLLGFAKSVYYSRLPHTGGSIGCASGCHAGGPEFDSGRTNRVLK